MAVKTPSNLSVGVSRKCSEKNGCSVVSWRGPHKTRNVSDESNSRIDGEPVNTLLMEIKKMKNAKNMRFGWLVAAALSCVCSINAFAATAKNDSKTGGRSKAERTAEEHLNESVQRIEMDKDLAALRERIAAKEQHAETLNVRLLQIIDRETALQGRLAVVEHQLKDNNIEKLLAGVGSTKPEELRATVRQALMIERENLQEQLQLLDQERARVMNSLATTDAVIDSLRMELAAATLAELR